MIIDMNKSAAFVCPHCVTLTTDDISLFDVTGKSDLKISCNTANCDGEPFSISKKNNTYTIKVHCAICSEVHTFKFSASKFIKSESLMLCCPNTMDNIAALTSPKHIDDAIEDLCDIAMISVSDKLEFADYEVLYQMVDRLSDLNEQGMIKCTCNNDDIDLDISDTQIILKCPMCDNALHMDITEQSLKALKGAVSLFLE